MSEEPHEKHNRLSRQIIDFTLPQINLVDKIEDKLVLIESICFAMVLMITEDRKKALVVWDITTDGVKERINGKLNAE